MRKDCTKEEIAWAAGLFEGEGSIAKTCKTAAQLVLMMTDPDVVERFRAICDCGSVYSYPRKDPKHKREYRWVVSEAREVEAALIAFLPYLGERRTARAIEVLERLKDCRGRGKDLTHCINGHEYTPENTYWHGPRMTFRACRICMATKYERRNAARRAA